MTLDEDRLTMLLRDVGEEPPRGARVDLIRALHEGRRRRRRRRLAAAGVTAVATVLAVGVLPMFLHSDRKPAPSAVIPPTMCAVSPLPLPEGSVGGAVFGGDSTGRWLVGVANGSLPLDRTAVLWDGDRIAEMPGALRTGVLRDVNSAGTAVGDTDDGAYVYRNGRIDPLPGAGGAQPRYVNDAGTVVGERVFSRNGTKVTLPVRWRSLTSAAQDLPLPGPRWEGRVTGLDDDGTVVGTVGDSSARSGVRGYLWHPDGTGEFLPLPPTVRGTGSAFWPLSIRHGWVVGQLRSTLPATTMEIPTLRLNLMTGEFMPLLPDSAHFAPSAGADQGWAVGRLGNEAGSIRGALLTDSGLVELPEPEAGRGEWDLLPQVVSDDGRTIAGIHGPIAGSRTAVPVRWQCR